MAIILRQDHFIRTTAFEGSGRPALRSETNRTEERLPAQWNYLVILRVLMPQTRSTV